MYHSFLIHSSADRHLGCFHVLAIGTSGKVQHTFMRVRVTKANNNFVPLRRQVWPHSCPERVTGTPETPGLHFENHWARHWGSVCGHSVIGFREVPAVSRETATTTEQLGGVTCHATTCTSLILPVKWWARVPPRALYVPKFYVFIN